MTTSYYYQYGSLWRILAQYTAFEEGLSSWRDQGGHDVVP